MLTDRYGMRILPGSVVTYPTRTGSRLSMVTAVVDEVKHGENGIGNYEGNFGKIATIDITVFPLTEHTYYAGRPMSQRRTHLTSVARLTVLPHLKAITDARGDLVIESLHVAFN